MVGAVRSRFRNPDQPDCQGRGQGQGQNERGEQGNHHRHSERPEEHPLDAVDERQRDEHHHGCQGRADQRPGDLFGRPPDRLDGGEAGGDVGGDALDDHDGVVDHEADGGGDPAERHQVEAHAEQLHRHQRGQDRDRDDHHGDGRGAERGQPALAALQEADHDGDRQEQPEQDALPHAADRLADQEGLVVEHGHPHVGRQLLTQLDDSFFNAVGDADRAAVVLAADVQQDGPLPVGGDDVELRLLTRHHFGHVLDADGAALGLCDHDVADVGCRFRPGVYHREVKLAILVPKPCLTDQVVLQEGVTDLTEREVIALQLKRIDPDVILGCPTAHEVHAGHAGDSEQPGLDVVPGRLPEIGLGPPARAG